MNSKLLAIFMICLASAGCGSEEGDDRNGLEKFFDGIDKTSKKIEKTVDKIDSAADKTRKGLNDFSDWVGAYTDTTQQDTTEIKE